MTFQGFGLPDELRMLADTIAEFIHEIRPVEARLPPGAREIPQPQPGELREGPGPAEPDRLHPGGTASPEHCAAKAPCA